MEREIFLETVILDHEEASGLFVFWVESYCEFLKILQLLFSFFVMLEKCFKLSEVSLLENDLAPQ